MRIFKKKKSFFSLLVFNYILFTVAVIILFALFLFFAIWKTVNNLNAYSDENISKFESELSSENYAEISFEKIFGAGGYFEVLDEERNIIFSSSTSVEHSRFSKKEIELIPSHSSNTSVYHEKITDENNETQNLIRVSSKAEGDELRNKFFVTDESANVIFSINGEGRKTFTEKELELLNGNINDKYIIKKLDFKTKSNRDYIALLYIPIKSEDSLSGFFGQIFGSFGIATKMFLASYLLLIILFVALLNKKVRKPLLILNDAILNVTKNRYENRLIYKGPSEFEQICESFNQMSKQLDDSEKARKSLENAKQKMLADISHDLKTPITVIKGYSKAVCDKLMEESEREQYLEAIYNKAEVLNELIDAFYEYSKMEHPDYKLVLEKENICEYSRQYLASKYNEICIAGFSLYVNIPEEAYYCKIDKLQLRRVYDNIISNALKHNQSGTEISFSISEEGQDLRIIISDSGYGIPSEIAENIFEPFVTGDDSRSNKQGSGLGLAISKKIIEAHCGSIKFISRQDEKYKTQFEILLPKSE